MAPPHKGENDLLSGGQIESEEQIERSSDHDLETLSKNDNGSQISDDKRKSTGTKSNRTAGPSQVQSSNQKSPSISPESDLVSSTNKEDDEIPPQPTQSQSESEHKDSDPCGGSDDRSESTVYEDSEVSHSQSEHTDSKSEQTDNQSEQTDSKSESTIVSPDASEEAASSEKTLDDFDADDSDSVRERRNPKTCVERQMPQQQFEDSNKPKPFPQNFQRNRHTRPQMLRPNHPYGMPGGPDFNPAFMQQYRGARRPMLPVSQADFMRGHSMNMMRGPPNHMQRMPPGMPPHSRMPGGPGMLGPPHQRLPRPPFQSPPGMFGNNPGMPPQGTIFNFN